MVRALALYRRTDHLANSTYIYTHRAPHSPAPTGDNPPLAHYIQLHSGIFICMLSMLCYYIAKFRLSKSRKPGACVATGKARQRRKHYKNKFTACEHATRNYAYTVVASTNQHFAQWHNDFTVLFHATDTHT